MSNSRGLPTKWFEGIKDEEHKKSLESHLRNSYNYVALVKLKEIVNKRIDELSRAEVSKSVYDNPNWSHLQAHNNGQRETLQWMLDLLAFVK